MHPKTVLLIDLLAYETLTANPYNNVNRNNAYAYFVNRAADFGLQVWITHFNNISDDSFFFYWTTEGDNWVAGTNNLGNVQVAYAEVPPHIPRAMDVRGLLMAAGITIINDPRLLDIATDKMLSYELFPEHIPYTISVNAENLEEKVSYMRSLDNLDDDLSGRVLFLKPRFGLMGDGIYILEQDTPLPQHLEGEYILQLFLESGNGIPELGIEGRHDLRLFIHNGKIVQFKARLPKNNPYVCNRNHKGISKYYNLDECPKYIADFATQVDKSFSYMYPRLYSMDIGISENGNPRIYEFNTMPGLAWKETDPESKIRAKEIQSIILNMLAEVAHKQAVVPVLA